MSFLKWNSPSSTIWDRNIGSEFLPIESEMGSMMDSYLNRKKVIRPKYSQTYFSPSVDLQEDVDKYILEAELPGINEKDVSIDLYKNTLTIKGEKKKDSKSKKEDYVCDERVSGSFKREVVFPTSVRADSVEAELKDGVLKIECLKDLHDIKRHRKISIKG